MTVRPHRPPRRFAFALATAVVAACAGVQAGVAAPGPESRPASTPEPLVVLDVAGQRLRLLYDGAVLRDYPVHGMEAGRPTVLSIAREVNLPPDDDVLTLRAVDPPRPSERPVVVAPEPGEEPLPAAPPPSPEEACPAPRAYFLRFEGGLTVEIRSDGPDENRSWFDAVREVVREIRSRARALAPRPEARIRLTMSAADAGALYRSLPTPSGWIVQRGPQ